MENENQTNDVIHQWVGEGGTYNIILDVRSVGTHRRRRRLQSLVCRRPKSRRTRAYHTSRVPGTAANSPPVFTRVLHRAPKFNIIIIIIIERLIINRNRMRRACTDRHRRRNY